VDKFVDKILVVNFSWDSLETHKLQVYKCNLNFAIWIEQKI